MGAQRHNGNRRIAGDGRWMGTGPATGLSRSVTSTDQNQSYLLQIETNQTRLPKYPDL